MRSGSTKASAATTTPAPTASTPTPTATPKPESKNDDTAEKDRKKRQLEELLRKLKSKILGFVVTGLKQTASTQHEWRAESASAKEQAISSDKQGPKNQNDAKQDSYSFTAESKDGKDSYSYQVKTDANGDITQMKIPSKLTEKQELSSNDKEQIANIGNTIKNSPRLSAGCKYSGNCSKAFCEEMMKNGVTFGASAKITDKAGKSFEVNQKTGKLGPKNGSKDAGEANEASSTAPTPASTVPTP